MTLFVTPEVLRQKLRMLIPRQPAQHRPPVDRCGARRARLDPDERRRRKAAYDARWHREHRATGRPTGRPRTSNHPRADYWRDYYARTTP